MNIKNTLLICALVCAPQAYAMKAKMLVRMAAPVTAAVLSERIGKSLFEKPLIKSEYPTMGMSLFPIFDILSKKAKPIEEAAPVLAREHVSIEKLNYGDLPAILEALKHATEDDKCVVAQEVADHLKRYKTTALIKMLQCSTKKPHRKLVNAVCKNITSFRTADIIEILNADANCQTHKLLAQAIGQHATYFTTYSFCGIQLYATNEYRGEYLSMLSRLQPEYQRQALTPILHSLGEYDVLRLLRIVKQEDNKQLILEAFNTITTINLSAYNVRELDQLFKLTQSGNQKVVAQAVAANIDAYNGWHFYSIFKYCTRESKAIIIAALMKNFETKAKSYDNYTLELIKAESEQPQLELIETYTKPTYVPVPGAKFTLHTVYNKQ
ncbi:MAG: hypothetical protein AB7F19_02540 [Candidatus Babeliales bacterium]